MAFVLAKRLKLSEEEMNELAFEVVDELKSLERFEDAAKVILEYLDDPNEAISLMTRARYKKRSLCLYQFFVILQSMERNCSLVPSFGPGSFIGISCCSFCGCCYRIVHTRVYEEYGKYQKVSKATGRRSREEKSDGSQYWNDRSSFLMSSLKRNF